VPRKSIPNTGANATITTWAVAGEVAHAPLVTLKHGTRPITCLGVPTGKLYNRHYDVFSRAYRCACGRFMHSLPASECLGPAGGASVLISFMHISHYYESDAQTRQRPLSRCLLMHDPQRGCWIAESPDLHVEYCTPHAPIVVPPIDGALTAE
jgi:hypothetical protein